MKTKTINKLIRILPAIRLANLALCLAMTSMATKDCCDGNTAGAVWLGTVALFPLLSTVGCLIMLPEDR